VDRARTSRLPQLAVFLLTALCVCLAVLLHQKTPWHREWLAGRLHSGNAEEREQAGAELARLGAESALVNALQSDSEDVRTVATRSLWRLWVQAGGREALALTRQAGDAAERHEYSEALRLLTQVTDQHPDFAEGWNRRATVYWQMGDYARSVADCQRAVELKPAHFAAWQGLGVGLVHLGDLDGACESLRMALRITPHDRFILHFLLYCQQLRDALHGRSLQPLDII
jgi:tetratricopeptide (TPR) repeat protein